MPIYDFMCREGHIFEVFTKHSTDAQICKCGAVAYNKPAMPKIGNIRMGVDPHGCPTAADKWAKAHEQGARPAKQG